MRLLPTILLAYVAVGLQVGLNGFVHLGGAAPNVVLIVAVFLALTAPRDVGRLACFALGLMQDLLTQQSLGLFALCYGALGVAIGSTQAMLHREHPATHALATVFGCALTWIVLMVHGWIFGPGVSFSAALLSTILTVVLAPALIWLLLRLRPTLGIRMPRKWT